MESSLRRTGNNGLVLVGIAFVGVGVALQITADTLTLAGEGIVLAISNALIRRFVARKYLLVGYQQTFFDVFLVVVSAVLSLIALQELVGGERAQWSRPSPSVS